MSETPATGQRQADLAAITVGMVSILVQTTLLRKLLALFSGNELVIALSLAVWLAGAGAGGLAGTRVVKPETAEKRLRLLALVLGLFLLAVLGLNPALRPMLRLMSGEAAGPVKILGGAAALLLAPSFLVGMAFPLSTALQPLAVIAAARAYRCEAIGALVAGGALTLVYYFPVPPSLVLAATFAGLILIAYPVYGKVPRWYGDPRGFDRSMPSHLAAVRALVAALERFRWRSCVYCWR